MTNKQELINWMTEKRENLPFESKVQLIYDFWNKKDEIKNFLQKYSKNDLKEVEQLIEESNKENQNLKEKENILTNLDNLNDTIISLNEEITEKDDRNAQLGEILKTSALIFQKQNGVIATLRAKLVKEQNKSGASKEYIEHCKEDIKRLDEEKQELDSRIQELEASRTDAERLRDEELREEKEKVTNLTTQLNNAIRTDELVYNLLGQHSKKANLLERARHVSDCLTAMQQLFLGYRSSQVEMNQSAAKLKNNFPDLAPTINLALFWEEYAKEKFWWDKWTNISQGHLGRGGIVIQGNFEQFKRNIKETIYTDLRDK